MKRILLLSFLVSISSGFLAFANGNDWVFLGDRKVNFRVEKDTIAVGAHDGTFRKVKLKVQKNGIRILDMKIHYANGDVQDVGLRSVIKAGGESRVIDLSGTKRVISKVTFRYESLNSRRGKALVQLYGRR